MDMIKLLVMIFLLLSFAGPVFAVDDEVKIIRMNGQNYKIWTDKDGIRRIDPVYFVKKSEMQAETQETADVTAEVKEGDVEAKKAKGVDVALTVVEEMTYGACRNSLAAAEAMASVYNVIFDYPKGQKFTVLMVVDNKTVQLKCEYGNRITTTWDN
ncbi:MAG: hypothetical protein KKG53_00370 [Proteobacteria bacterium]|nr:hypothetical protein [Pseudomonadota bacterium]